MVSILFDGVVQRRAAGVALRTRGVVTTRQALRQPIPALRFDRRMRQSVQLAYRITASARNRTARKAIPAGARLRHRACGHLPSPAMHSLPPTEASRIVDWGRLAGISTVI